jgi:hypothetical protein
VIALPGLTGRRVIDGRIAAADRPDVGFLDGFESGDLSARPTPVGGG